MRLFPDKVGISAYQKKIGKHTAPFNLGARSCQGLDSHKIWSTAEGLVLETLPSAGQGSSTRRRLAAGELVGKSPLSIRPGNQYGLWAASANLDMAGDFKFEKGNSFGEWLHEQMREAVHFETEAWAIERASRIAERLQADRPEVQRLIVEIPWLEVVTAFTAPGRYIYFSRRLYERCVTDDQVALVVAHEIAHHDLGHINLFAGWAHKIIGLPGATLFAFAFHALERRLYGPETECDADRHGMDLCLEAGYDGRRALELFDILEQHALDMGDYDIVYGPDEESDDELDEDASWMTKVQIWAWQRKRGYLPVRDRRQMLMKHLRK